MIFIIDLNIEYIFLQIMYIIQSVVPSIIMAELHRSRPKP